ncbi:dynamin family protein [Chroococcidiopsis cubana]|uniref:dynamin family protein n=1 Tax=Chroococcidiopsis cubana TaxID=171392 RepID=UPI002ACE26A1|nr:dynamin family protein [Chroococcidiopsis cubana]
MSQKLHNQKFRVAVVGEFSQGKSTVLNALLGEKIQPIRAIPCSGVVTTLKHGYQTKIVCYYKNGNQEEISFEQYQIKSAIVKEAALDCLSEHLVSSEIDEIVFEHPNLELCRNGVEIIDSPGLNEHPERSLITQKLLKDIDAVIFLANASRPLTKWEQDYLSNDLRISLNGGKDNEPANNIFILVNFIDLLDEEEDRHDVMQRFETFVSGKNPIVRGGDRIHFISAKAALKGIANGTEDAYVKIFKNFTCALEKFLTNERGYIKIQHSSDAIKILVQSILSSLNQAENTLDGKINLSEAEKQKILEQIGEASGRDFILQDHADQLVQNVIQQICESWNKWIEGLADRVADKGAEWHSKYPSWEKEKLLQDYANQFTRSLSQEMDDWWKTQVIDGIVKSHFSDLNQKIRHELEAIKSNFQIIDSQLSDRLNGTL